MAEIKHYKLMASDTAEKLQKEAANKSKFESVLKAKDQEINSANERIKELEMRVGQINTELIEQSKEKLSMQD
eukprot:CAMPEP_0176341678 /NCGR_PEP_ID=MMETSP0126-20121128/2573_1 /TAXON_ID=141414 ORGANISM="Strombidinopsis acuminatum, Strain SPMC142" /NCGR_SAMPLE_ID=MMETSP0126 /ASSEMBLY_ACC=CAM_ASM_000229 /LENGTH=72 /DNA_ID=CAMNT_0017686645 /DNA_START=171 /DNA_END=389 /DNA_ORIENTATION=+